MPTRRVGAAPRSWLLDAEDRDQRRNGWHNSPFGVLDQDLIEWKQPRTGQERGDLAAAKVQHRFVQHVRWFMQRRGLDNEAVAVLVGMSSTHFGRILNGVAHVSLTDVVRIADTLNRDVRISYPDRSDSH